MSPRHSCCRSYTLARVNYMADGPGPRAQSEPKGKRVLSRGGSTASMPGHDMPSRGGRCGRGRIAAAELGGRSGATVASQEPEMPMQVHTTPHAPRLRGGAGLPPSHHVRGLRLQYLVSMNPGGLDPSLPRPSALRVQPRVRKCFSSPPSSRPWFHEHQLASSRLRV